ncbi:MAG: hypothetical protein EOM91_17645 [Sphingobacteriia bacterium]|nr:hypothetical protein [Sphingobacteriia bacterium]
MPYRPYREPVPSWTPSVGPDPFCPKTVSGHLAFGLPGNRITHRRRSNPDPARVSNIANPEVVMRLAHRLVLALLIVVADTAAFAVPLASVLLAYILLARPAWFRDWVERLYCGVSR